MESTKVIAERIRRIFLYRSIIRDKKIKRDFFSEIALINFNRQRIFGYFLLVMGSYQLFADFFFGDFWETYQVSFFMVLDTTVVIAGLTIVLISSIRPPRTPLQIKPWHLVYFYIYLVYHLSWSAAISIIEAKAANGVPTFLIGVFAAATIYLHRGIPFLIYLLVSLGALFGGLIYMGISTAELVTQYIATIVLILLAWFVSRVLMITRMRSYLSKKEVETARDNLDQMVKERTVELENTNTKLREEIRERQRYEKGLEREKKKAQEADRLKSVFLANMSHEIRTPLNGIIGFGDLLKNPGLSPEKKARYLEIIDNNGQQLLKLIDDLMDISMIESNQLKLNQVKFRLGHILPDAEVFYKNYARVQNKAHLQIQNYGFDADSDDTLNSDPARIQQVLYNLLSNAVKFTHEGYIRFGGKSDDGYCLLYVEDTGIGIQAEKCNMIFEQFRQGEESTSRTYGGTGLGLSISKGIVELLNGLLWVDLSYTQGARFCFSLPSASLKEIYDQKQLVHGLNELSKKALVINMDERDSVGFLDYFARCLKLNIQKTSIHKLKLTDTKSHPELIIANLDQLGKDDPEEVIHKISGLSDAFLTGIIEPDGKLRQLLLNKGCDMVLEHPVNVNLLLAKILSKNSKKVMV